MLYSCDNKYKGDFTVVKANYVDDYSYPCIIYNEGKKLNIDYIYRYKDGNLIDYQGCASEGLYTENLKNYDNYSKEDYKNKNLSIKKINNNVIFFDKEYQIMRKNKDSLFTTSKTKDEYLIFIGNIPATQSHRL
ncbi:MAG TPA: hypothetical protein DEB71_18455 [Chryseobacterium carnipullorum]|nr:hypothetical protein [Chryseobacterium carnipullorum]